MTECRKIIPLFKESEGVFGKGDFYSVGIEYAEGKSIIGTEYERWN